MNVNIALVGYASAALAFFLLAILLLTAWRQRAQGSLLLLSCAASSVWAGTLAVSSVRPGEFDSHILIIEIFNDSAWLLCLSSLLGGAIASKSNWIVRRSGVILAVILLGAGILLELEYFKQRFEGLSITLLLLGSIATSLYALVALEQLYRNSRPKQKNGLKFLCLGLGGMFAYDLLLYSNAIVDGQFSVPFWEGRGYVVALCVPAIATAVSRTTSWGTGLFVSRQIIFYTSTLIAAGFYLAFIGSISYFLRGLRHEWSDVLQVILFSSAVLAFFALFMSEQLRAKTRVWLTKHFFERKYDYRSEWLRLIHTLTSDDASLALKKRAIKALAQIVGAPSGRLWLADSDTNIFSPVSSWNMPVGDGGLAEDAPLIQFFHKTNWIIDIDELKEEPEKYRPLGTRDLNSSLLDSGFMVPLYHDSGLLGVVELSPLRTATSLNFEDHDLLKTAGLQVASYLAQEIATEQLAESRQFEAFNRFTAFIMHDLKNAIAQQSMVVENAKRHKRNPEFIDDAMEAIKGSVARMRRVLGHLQQGPRVERQERIDLTKLLLQVQSQCADREPVPQVQAPEKPVLVNANRDSLLSAFSHAVRNAQDATAKSGTVRLELESVENHCCLRVIDSGCGMSPKFIRDQLFRPFYSTKGAEGMGIGAYQIREIIRSCGGEVVVTSREKEGTVFELQLPLAKNQV